MRTRLWNLGIVVLVVLFASPRLAAQDASQTELASKLEQFEQRAAKLDAAVVRLYQFTETALELQHSNPRDTSSSYASLSRDEQLTWQIAHLSGLKMALIAIYDHVTDEVPGESLNRQLAGVAQVWAEVEALVARSARRSPELEARLLVARGRWRAISDCLAPQVKPMLARNAFALAASDPQLANAPLYPAVFLDDKAPYRGGVLIFDRYFLETLQQVIDPVEQQQMALEIERDQLEVRRLKDIRDKEQQAAQGAEVDPKALSEPARISQTTDRFHAHREAEVNELRLRFQRYVRQAHDLGVKVQPAAFIDAAQVADFGVPQKAALVTALDSALAELKMPTGKHMREIEQALESELSAWQGERGGLLRDTPAMSGADVQRSVRAFTLDMQYAGKHARLANLRSAIRRDEARLQVAHSLAVDTLQNIHSDDVRIAALDQRWRNAALRYYGIALLKVLVIVVAAWIALGLLSRFANRIVRRISSITDRMRQDQIDDMEARAKTLTSVFMATSRVVVWVTALLMILSQLDVNYQPLLLATGGVTLAIGFGAQSLVKDFFAGFFIIFENQYTVGDVIDIKGKTGSVEAVNLRTTRVRGADGTLHIVPNGEITNVSNMTFGWSRLTVTVGVACHEDPDEVEALLNRVGEEMFADPAWKTRLIEAPKSIGLDGLGASSLDFKVLGKTIPGEQWQATREYRRRVKIALELAGIEMPYQYINYVETAAQPSKLLKRRGTASGSSQRHAPDAPVAQGAHHEHELPKVKEREPGRMPSD